MGCGLCGRARRRGAPAPNRPSAVGDCPVLVGAAQGLSLTAQRLSAHCPLTGLLRAVAGVVAGGSWCVRTAPLVELKDAPGGGAHTHGNTARQVVDGLRAE